MHRHMPLPPVRLATVLVLLLAATACSPAPPASGPQGAQSTGSTSSGASPISIGVLVPETGKGGDWGKKFRAASDIAAEEINAAGGINGSPLKLVILDTAGDNEQSVIQLRKLVNDEKVLAVLGPGFSAENDVCLPQANLLKTVLVSPTATTPGQAAKNRPWGYQYGTTLEKMLPGAYERFIKFFEPKQSMKRVVIAADMKDSAMAGAATQDFKQIVSNNKLELLDTVEAQTGQTDFSAQVTRIKSLKPDFIMAAFLYNEGASFAKELQRQGVSAPVFGHSAVNTTLFTAQAGNAAEGWVVPSPYWPESSDARWQAWQKKFAARVQGQVQDTNAAWNETFYYDATYAMAQVMKQQGVKSSMDPSQARDLVRQGWDQLKGFDAPSGTGTVNMNQKGEALRDVYALEVKGGKFKLLGN